MKSAAAITFERRPSWLLALSLALLTGLALSAVWSSGLRERPEAAGLVSLLCLILLLRQLRGQFVSRWRRAAWDSAGNWQLLDLHAAAQPMRLTAWHALGLCLLLRLRSDAGERVNLVLLPDNLDADTRRRLRVRLQQASAAAAVPPLN